MGIYGKEFYKYIIEAKEDDKDEEPVDEDLVEDDLNTDDDEIDMESDEFEMDEPIEDEPIDDNPVDDKPTDTVEDPVETSDEDDIGEDTEFELPEDDDTGDNIETDAADGLNADNNDNDSNSGDIAMGNDGSTGEDVPGDSNDTSSDTSLGDNGSTNADEGSGELKEVEDQLYDSLTEDQKRLKRLELKKLYREIYNSSTGFSDQINNIPKTDEFVSISARIVNSLLDLKEIVGVYLSNNFDDATYIENSIMYQKFLYTLKGIEMALLEISKQKAPK